MVGNNKNNLVVLITLDVEQTFVFGSYKNKSNYISILCTMFVLKVIFYFILPLGDCYNIRPIFVCNKGLYSIYCNYDLCLYSLDLYNLFCLR